MKSIKKLLCTFLTMLLLVSAITPVIADNNIKVRLGGELIKFDVQPQLINNRTMVPLRAIFEALGATVDWNGDTQTVTSTKDKTTISLTINNPTMYVNGAAVTLDSPACLVGGRTLVPVRAISEAFGVEVKWEESTTTVELIEPDGGYSKKMLENYYHYAVNNALDDMMHFANCTGSFTSYDITQNDLRFYLADLSGDGQNEIIITDCNESLYIVYTFVNNEVKKIYETVNGFMGTGAWLTEYNGEFYMVNESFSSGTGFRISLLQFDSLTKEVVEKHHMCMQFEYIEDGVPAEVYEKFSQMVVDNKRLFSPIQELKDKIMK